MYVCNDGPRFETPAEVRLYAQWGGDVVGMMRNVLDTFVFVTEDRPLEADLRATIARIQQRHWQLYVESTAAEPTADGGQG